MSHSALYIGHEVSLLPLMGEAVGAPHTFYALQMCLVSM